MTAFDWQKEGSFNEFHSGGVHLVNVHAPEVCSGRPCTIHNPSDHHMRDWPLIWRDPRDPFGMYSGFERQCPHGIGHPDPDEVHYKIHILGEDPKYVGIHGCDGCCA